LHEISITWDDYHRKIEELAVKIHSSEWDFNQIICIAKGGLRIGDSLARIFDLPLAILSASSYSGEGNRKRGELIFSRDLAMTTANLGSRVLLVDDLADSGITLKRSVAWVKHHYGFYVEEIRTAVLWYKAISQYQPDYYVDYLPDSPWIRQPFERYERLSPLQLAQELSRSR
jgi:hypoxanthine phosphoribosyltransferase